MSRPLTIAWWTDARQQMRGRAPGAQAAKRRGGSPGPATNPGPERLSLARHGVPETTGLAAGRQDCPNEVVVLSGTPARGLEPSVRRAPRRRRDWPRRNACFGMRTTAAEAWRGEARAGDSCEFPLSGLHSASMDAKPSTGSDYLLSDTACTFTVLSRFQMYYCRFRKGLVLGSEMARLTQFLAWILTHSIGVKREQMIKIMVRSVHLDVMAIAKESGLFL